jgi:hypothetical protein
MMMPARRADPKVLLEVDREQNFLAVHAREKCAPRRGRLTQDLAEYPDS